MVVMDWRSLLPLFFAIIGYVTRSVTAQSERVVAMLGEPVNLTCQTPSGDPVWYRDEIPLTGGGGRMIINDTLTIPNPMMRDAGRYTCIDPAQTATDLFAKDYSLIVQRRPVITMPPVGLHNVAAGAKVTFGCIAEGSPPPLIEWIINSPNVTILSTLNGSTSFLDVMAPPGDYEITCALGPSMSDASKTVSMFVTDDLFNGTVDVKGFNNVTIDNDDPTTFRCLVPPVENGTVIQWTRDGVEDATVDNELTVSPSQTGVYCCAVDGVTVRCAYIYRRIRPRINRISRSVSTVSGRSVSLYCEATGEEPATIRWQYENRTLIMNSSEAMITGNIAESHLTLTNVQAENSELEVICVATNNRGDPDEHDVSITTVGSCTNNLVTAPGSSLDSWDLPSDTFWRTDVAGESVFQITYSNLTGRSELITHELAVNNSIEALHFRAQVRQNDDELIPTVILIPRVCLSVMGMNGMQCASNVLDDDQLDGWQWVEGVLNFTALGISRNNSMTMVRVELYADRTGAATASNGEVFFDNICVEPLFAAVDNEPTSSEDDNDITIFIIIGASVGGALLLVLLVILHIICCCVCCRKNEVKVGRFRKQSMETIRRYATQSAEAKGTNAIRYHPNPTKPANHDSSDYGYNYVSPNKPGDENYDAARDMYLKLDGTQNKQANPYQSMSTMNNANDDDGTELYDTINEPEQPQYEILPCESGETAQYLAVVADKDEEDTSEDPYLDVLPASEQEIYSDISDSQTKPGNGQELHVELYD